MNHWVAYKNSFLTWSAEFPMKHIRDIEPLFSLLKPLFTLGEQEKLFRVVDTEPASTIPNTLNDEYFHQMVNSLASGTSFRVFQLSGAKKLEMQSLIAYYDSEGKIVEEEIKDLGILLQRLWYHDAGKMEQFHSFMNWATQPISLHDSIIMFDTLTGLQMYSPPTISITLLTDIWFPKVLGFLDGVDPLAPYDNRELATRHTPRLNNFLRSFRKLTLDMGGIWRGIDKEDGWRLYMNQSDDSGIFLGS